MNLYSKICLYTSICSSYRDLLKDFYLGTEGVQFSKLIAVQCPPTWKLNFASFPKYINIHGVSWEWQLYGASLPGLQYFRPLFQHTHSSFHWWANEIGSYLRCSLYVVKIMQIMISRELKYWLLIGENLLVTTTQGACKHLKLYFRLSYWLLF